MFNPSDAGYPNGLRTYGTGSSQDWAARFVVAEDTDRVCSLEVSALCDGMDFSVEEDLVGLSHSLSQLCLVGMGLDV